MELDERGIFSSPLWFQLRTPTRLSDPLILQARTPCVLGWYLVASGIKPRLSGVESDALTPRHSRIEKELTE
ncbi:hypothetical protein TNCV_5093171, partial [Trichonephila clavipes]